MTYLGYLNTSGTAGPAFLPVTTLPTSPTDGDHVRLDDNIMAWKAATNTWQPVAARRLEQLPYDPLIDDEYVIIENAGRNTEPQIFTKYEDVWINPDEPLICPDCGQTQAIMPAEGGTRHIFTDEASFIAAKAICQPGDVLHGRGGDLVGYFEARGDRVTGRANPMPSGTAEKEIIITVDPDTRIVPGTGGVREDNDQNIFGIDVGEVDHVSVANVEVLGGWSSVRFQNVTGSAEKYCRISHLTASEATSAHVAIQASYADITQQSHYWQIDCSTLGPTRTGVDTPINPQYNEGIYVGTGSQATIGQDKSSHGRIRNVDFYDLTAEAIECKAGTHTVHADNVRAFNTKFAAAGPGGGSQAGVFAFGVPGTNYTPTEATGNFKLTNFVVDGCDNYYPVALGYGGTLVENGKISNYAAAGSTAIRVRSVAPYGLTTTGSQPIILRNIEADGGMWHVWDPEGQEPYIIDETDVRPISTDHGPTESRPLDPHVGETYWDTALDGEYRWDGTDWVATQPESFGSGDPVNTDYVASRGFGIVTNATALLGNNYNFDGYIYDAAVTPGLPGSFRFDGYYPGAVTSEELMAVDPNSTYRLSLSVRQELAAGFTATESKHMQFAGLIEYDIDGNLIDSATHMRWKHGGVDSLTTLAAPLTPGDTVVSVVDASGWNEDTPVAAQLGLTIYEYENSLGFRYDYYSRLYQAGLFSTTGVDKTANTITLDAALPAVLGNPNDVAGTWPIGTKIANTSVGATYKYAIMAGALVPTVDEWYNYSKVMGGTDTSGTNTGHNFSPGTAFVKFFTLPNLSNRAGGFPGYQDTGGTHSVWFAGWDIQPDAYAVTVDNGGVKTVHEIVTDYTTGTVSMAPAALQIKLL